MSVKSSETDRRLTAYATFIALSLSRRGMQRAYQSMYNTADKRVTWVELRGITADEMRAWARAKGAK